MTFDKPIQPGPLAGGNWSFKANDFPFAPADATAAASTVSGSSILGLLDPGPDVANYAAAPADVLSLTGLPAAAFTNFPLVVT